MTKFKPPLPLPPLKRHPSKLEWLYCRYWLAIHDYNVELAQQIVSGKISTTFDCKQWAKPYLAWAKRTFK